MTTASSDRFRRVCAIFDEALDLPVDQRDAFIDRASACDGEVRDAVHRLLRAHQRSEGFLESPAVEVAAPLLQERDVESDPGKEH